jgi:hypothetical protein
VLSCVGVWVVEGGRCSWEWWRQWEVSREIMAPPPPRRTHGIVGNEQLFFLPFKSAKVVSCACTHEVRH